MFAYRQNLSKTVCFSVFNWERRVIIILIWWVHVQYPVYETGPQKQDPSLFPITPEAEIVSVLETLWLEESKRQASVQNISQTG
jgi:hypothetical protein